MSLSTGKTRKGKFATPWHSGSSPTSISEKVKKVRFKLLGKLTDRLLLHQSLRMSTVDVGLMFKRSNGEEG